MCRGTFSSLSYFLLEKNDYLDFEILEKPVMVISLPQNVCSVLNVKAIVWQSLFLFKCLKYERIIAKHDSPDIGCSGGGREFHQQSV